MGNNPYTTYIYICTYIILKDHIKIKSIHDTQEPIIVLAFNKEFLKMEFIKYVIEILLVDTFQKWVLWTLPHFVLMLLQNCILKKNIKSDTY